MDQDLAHSECQILGIIYTPVQGGRDHLRVLQRATAAPYEDCPSEGTPIKCRARRFLRTRSLANEDDLVCSK